MKNPWFDRSEKRNLLSCISYTPVILALLALALYLPGIWWGAPHASASDRTHAWGVDDETPLGPLAEIHNIIEPKADRNLGYPLMYSFVVFIAYVPYLIYLWLTGQLTAVSGAYPFGLADPISTLKMLTLIARLVSVLMAVGIVVVAYDAGRTLWDHCTGILASLLVMLSFPTFYYARTGNVDIPVLFFTALALGVFARIITGGFTLQRAVWLGIFVGFGLATKEPAFASFLALPVVLFVTHLQDNRKATAGWSLWAFCKASLTALVTAFLAFGLGSGLFVNPERYFAHVEFAKQRVNALVVGNFFSVQTFPYTFDGHIQLSKVLVGYLTDSMSLPGLLLAGLGILWTLRREKLAATFVLPALTYLIILFWTARTAQLRYVMPPVFTLSFFAARAVTLALQSKHMPVRAGLAVVVFGVIGLNLSRGIDLTYVMINDSRYAAAVWLESWAQTGARIEYFGPDQKLPSLKPDIITAPAIQFAGSQYQPNIDDEAVNTIRQGWQERKPDFVIVMPDHTSSPGSSHSATLPPNIYENLLNGTLGYHLAAYFETPPLFPWVQRPALDYPTVNPPIRVFARSTETAEEESTR